MQLFTYKCAMAIMFLLTLKPASKSKIPSNFPTISAAPRP